MLTRDSALQRLLLNGTLSASARPGNAITAAQAADPVVRRVKQIITSNQAGGAVRALAPSANHGVLP
jgi:hypothetical protein